MDTWKEACRSPTSDARTICSPAADPALQPVPPVRSLYIDVLTSSECYAVVCVPHLWIDTSYFICIEPPSACFLSARVMLSVSRCFSKIYNSFYLVLMRFARLRPNGARSARDPLRCACCGRLSAHRSDRAFVRDILHVETINCVYQRVFRISTFAGSAERCV